MPPFCFSTPDFAATTQAALSRARALKLGNELGHGSISRVAEAVCPTTWERFAVKRVGLPSGAGKEAQRLSVLQRVAREAAVAQALATAGNPDGLVRHYACVYDSEADAVLLVMQACTGPCLAELRRRQPGGRLPEARVLRMLASVGRSLAALHSLGILAAENVLLHSTDSDPDHVVLVDFDLCRDAPGAGASADNGPGGSCERAAAEAAAAFASITPGASSAQGGGGSGNEGGQGGGFVVWGTAEYLAYELLKDGASAYAPASDWWALGVLGYELLYGRSPWICGGGGLEALLHRVSHYSPPFPSPAEGGPQVGPSTVQLLRGLLRQRADVRLGGGPGRAQEVLGHAALRGCS
ncbi:hypothetical protein HYH03_004967 [Edaphochlamys debaryana]|uniref:non-specific serine/threonine protein kinase n=1 Tax=Edaphochlamys debaryana TaxID=47281 RepID=A0A836C1J1_9CHLO|nr:hypothetical protein HYH03_004967 [Edaphochlamys debaryana]|eukprot:KAG2496961.1 hypothetical protein HYH03_004967 [Edaphochlamys debaryana]